MASFKEAALGGGLKLGTFIGEFATPGIGHIMKNAGLDFVFLDMEHTGFDVIQMKSVLRYFEAAGLATLVRPAGKDYYDMARMLDIGAQGLCVPMVSSAEEARSIVRQCKYVPDGERGVAIEEVVFINRGHVVAPAGEGRHRQVEGVQHRRAGRVGDRAQPHPRLRAAVGGGEIADPVGVEVLRRAHRGGARGDLQLTHLRRRAGQQ